MIRQKIPQTYMRKCQSLKVPPWQLWKHRTQLLHGRATFVKSCEKDALWLHSRRDSYHQPCAKRFGHWEEPSFPIIWRMHHLVSHLSITQCPMTKRSRTSPSPWRCRCVESPQPLSTLSGWNPFSQEWVILPATPLLKQEVRCLTGTGFDRVWSGLCQVGRVI